MTMIKRILVVDDEITSRKMSPLEWVHGSSGRLGPRVPETMNEQRILPDFADASPPTRRIEGRVTSSKARIRDRNHDAFATPEWKPSSSPRIFGGSPQAPWL